MTDAGGPVDAGDDEGDHNNRNNHHRESRVLNLVDGGDGTTASDGHGEKTDQVRHSSTLPKVSDHRAGYKRKKVCQDRPAKKVSGFR